MEMFVSGFVLSLSACLDLGIVNVATIKRGLDSGAAAAFALSLGSCVGDLCYATLSMLGLALVLAEPHVRVLFWLGGTAVLLYLSAATLRETFRDRSIGATADAGDERRLRSDFGRGVILALSSPSLIVWFASAGGAVIAGIYARTHAAPLLFMAGFFCAGVTWAVVLSLASGRGRRLLGRAALRACSGASAALFFALAVKVFADGLAYRG